MKFSKILFSAAMLASSLSGFAQEEVVEYTYCPNWYVQGQFGAQYTLGEIKTGKLISPNAQVAVGYNFNPYVGMRLAVNAWQSREGADICAPIYSHQYRWKWNYVAPTLDVTVNLTNVFGGYRPRLCDVNAFLGFGANIGFHNHEANDCQADYAHYTGQKLLGNLWDGTKARFVTQFGADLQFNLNQHWALGLELMANVLPDGYNSKKAGNADWYFNGLVGVKYTFGKRYTKTTRVVEAPAPQVIERIIEKIVEKPVQPVVVEKVTEKPKVEINQLRRDIFFKISNTSIAKDQMPKVDEVAKFLKEVPGSKVAITGYADKGTGTMAINLRLAKQRADIVAKTLMDDYHISADRIIVKSMGENEFQPYDNPVDNRVAICICHD